MNTHRKVLLVDDLPHLYPLEVLLEGSGVKVILAKSPKEALEQIGEPDFDLGLFDVCLPAPMNSINPDADAKVMGIILCKQFLEHKGWRGKLTLISIMTDFEFRDLIRREDLSHMKKLPFFSIRTEQDIDKLIKHIEEKLNLKLAR